MNIHHFLLKLGFSLGLSVLSIACYAQCNYQSGHNLNDYSFSVDNVITSISLASNQAPNTKLGPEVTIPNGMYVYYTCGGARNFHIYRYGTTMIESIYPGIYKTNIPGIGIKVLSTTMGVDAIGHTLSKNPFDNGGYYFIGYLFGLKIQFYVIGPVSVGNEPLKLDFTVEGWANTITTTTTGGVMFNRVTITSNTPLTVKSCETPDISVDLKKHSKSDFASVGSTSAATPFNFEIKKCSKDMAAVKYTFKPAAGINLVNSGGSNQHITLRSGSTASGVGIQVLYANDTLVPFNSAQIYGGYSPSLGGDYVIPMKARYIRTGEVSPGSANSAVEFTMSYE